MGQHIGALHPAVPQLLCPGEQMLQSDAPVLLDLAK